MATHPPETAYVGDDWVLQRKLPEPAASGSTLEWVLATRGALAQAIAPDLAIVSDDGDGNVTVRVPRSITLDITPGRYFDSLRVTLDDVTTQVVGQIEVINPGFEIQLASDSPSGDSP
jgi:hypothetical protein